jgi:hypothetical protein
VATDVVSDTDVVSNLRTSPINQEARGQRRNLMVASAVALLVVELGLFPARISALGIEFGTPDRRSLLKALLIAVVFFLVSFMVNAVGDVAEWYWRLGQGLRAAVHVARPPTEEDEQALDNFVQDYKVSNAAEQARMVSAVKEFELQKLEAKMWGRVVGVWKPAAYVRLGIDFLAPLALACWAIGALVCALWW